MQKLVRGMGIVFVGLWAACSSAPSAETRTQGIASVEIDRKADGVALRALDAKGAELGKLAYSRGPVVVDELGPEAVDGVSLAVQVGELMLNHTSAGHQALELPLEDVREDEAKVVEFLLDSRVAAEMARWDVSFFIHGAQSQPANEAGDQPFATCTYSANSACGPGECFQFTGTPVYQNRCCQTAKSAVRRQCTGNPGGTNSCGTVGPLGCSVCWSVVYANNFSGQCWIDPANGSMYWQGNLNTNCIPTNYQFCFSDYECCSRNCDIPNQRCDIAI